MSVSIRFFASLRDQTGIASTRLEIADAVSAADLWQRATRGLAMPANTLVAINMEYADASEAVHDGDEVAFFPPVTGG